MKRQRKIFFLFLFAATVLIEIGILVNMVHTEKQPWVGTPSVHYATPSTSHTWGSAPSFSSSSTLLNAHYTPTVSVSSGNTLAPSYSSTSWTIHTVSSQTVHSIGGGGGNAGVTGSSSHSSNRGVLNNSFSVPTLTAVSIPLSARNLQDGMTAEQGLSASMPRRTIIHDGSGTDEYGDENLKPTYDPTDPFFTPVGDTPWFWFIGLCLLYTMSKIIRSKHRQKSGAY